MISYKDTELWSVLQRKEPGDAHLNVTNDALSRSELILASSGTSPLEFTLHDSEHSFRVAERMNELITEEQRSRLSASEVALLLMAAYTHDIGMSPPQGIVEAHLSYLITGSIEALSAADIAILQRWLDNNQIDRNTMAERIANGDVVALREMRLALAYFIRFMHNDWSERWIRENLRNISPVLYANWLDDLVTLCRSHHEGIAHLRTPRFDARIVGKGQTVNLRFLACILRIADVIEFDPERTPEIIYKHRSIPDSSKIYWHKDHELSILLDHVSHLIRITSRPSNPIVYHAVLQTVAQVDQELSCCSTLYQEGALYHGAIPDSARETYRWSWPSRVTSDIRELDNSFVYIDGTFRPNTKRLLQLLSGTALYGDPMAAIRELLQNSIDAVREQIAHERLQNVNPLEPALMDRLGNLHLVRLSLEFDGTDHWLRCSDDGVGMTRDIIEKYFLISGAGANPEARSLERRAMLDGFSVERTGEFGIGVLSYFMLADQMQLITRRSLEGNDSDNVAWSFSIEGVDGFGSLVRADRSSRGSDVRLRLNKSVVGEDPHGWFCAVARYVSKTIVRSPCRIEVVNDVTGRLETSCDVGWSHYVDQFVDEVVRSVDLPSADLEIKTAEEQEAEQEKQEQHSRIVKDIFSTIQWAQPAEFALDVGVGRALLPYFLIDGEASLVYLSIVDGKIQPFPDGSEMLKPSFTPVFSWKGFGVNSNDRGRYNVQAQIDFVKGASISVDRANLRINGYTGIERLISDISKKQSNDFERLELSERFRTICQVAKGEAKFLTKAEASQIYWKIVRDAEGPKLVKINYPLVDLLLPTFESGFEEAWIGSDGRIVDAAAAIIGRFSHWLRLSSILGGGRIAIYRSRYSSTEVGLQWDSEDSVAVGASSLAATFPPEWSQLAGILSPGRVIWNASHALVEGAGQVPHARLRVDRIEVIKYACESKSASCWYLLCLLAKGTKTMERVKHNFPDALAEISRLAGLENGERCLFWRNADWGISEDEVIALTGDSWVTQRVSFREGQLLGDVVRLSAPAQDWWISRLEVPDAF